ncbi:hypothetical protein ACFGVS_28110 [Mucilaginibacter sp. AW1-7]|jgi:hypothetical protein|uniref:hypothetical protein n=1 Tax=unclassified Mucilaginibacter TaxID=2617802 RepID=UPI0008BEADD6|nr:MULTISPECIES: hypothetical protein [unclassified Mucilaginibacter]WDF76168.1 hypothetical protein PQ469_19955 [Mucilaginibacter sp. KACC 22773]SEO90712.1 hypothetical protein SAMN05428947_1051 [Mucilaginibacter sp. OK283]
MKLFYHFLFFVIASLVLLACASVFASDPQVQSQTDEFTSPEPDDDSPVHDSTIAADQTGLFVLTGLKDNTQSYLFYAVNGKQKQVYKKYSYLDNFQVVFNQFSLPQKFK